MKKHLFKLVTTVLLVAAVGGLLLAGCAKEEAPAPTPEAEKTILIAGCGIGGAFYPYSCGLMTLINDFVPDYRAIAQVTGCSVENCRLIESKKVQVAFQAAGTVLQALEARPPKFDHKYSLASIATLAGSHGFWMTTDSNIKTLTDLKGKRVALGDPGSTTTVRGVAMLEAVGITEADLTPVMVNESAAAAAMKDGTVRAWFCSASATQASIIELTTSKKTYFMDLSADIDKICAHMMETGDFVTSYVLPAGTYEGMDKDYATYLAPQIISVHPDLDEELVYQITKVLWENIETMYKVHAGCLQWKLENNAQPLPNIPLHPGAERYYKEAGVMK